MSDFSLRDYQLEAIDKLRCGCILCGGYGSGKSRTSIAYYFKENGGDLSDSDSKMVNPLDLYIITTAKKRDEEDWDSELAMFMLSTDPDLNYYNNRVVVDSWNNIRKYEDVEKSFFIFDEQRVVGKGAWAKTFVKIARKNFWILLSATPGDTWSDYIPVFVANNFYKTRSAFLQEHVIFRRFAKYPQIESYVGTKKLIFYRDQILVPMDFIRSTEPHEVTIPVEYDRIKYKSIMKTRWDPWRDKPFSNAAELCYALRRVVNSDDSRAQVLLELADRHPRMIVFYNFDYELYILRTIFFGEGFAIAEWNGHKHQDIPDVDDWIYLVQYAAGAEGWNCVKTDTIVFYSQSYSYKTMVQAKGRIDRLNTPFTDLYYYYFKSTAPIDLAISRALHEKRNFNEKKFVGGQ